MIKIHIGCGKRNFGKDWIHIDGEDYPHLDYKITSFNALPFQSEKIDLIYCSHAIEYFDREEIIVILKEWNRILKQNGIIRLAVPDFRSMAELYTKGKYPLDAFLGPLYGKMKLNDKYIYHKTVYDLESIKQLLMRCGFKNIRTYDWRTTDHAAYDDCSQAYLPHLDKENGTLISLNVEGIK